MRTVRPENMGAWGQKSPNLRGFGRRVAFDLIAALVASLASVVAIAVLPRAQYFLAKLQLNPQPMPVH